MWPVLSTMQMTTVQPFRTASASAAAATFFAVARSMGLPYARIPGGDMLSVIVALQALP